jgi:hypothetical protein
MRVATLLVVSMAGCYVEDRGYAADIATHIELLEVRDGLECWRLAKGGYPSSLPALISQRMPATCHLAEGATWAVQYSQDPRRTRPWHAHEWAYRPMRLDGQGRYQGYELSATDSRGKARYRSFWLDATGVLRSAQGRPARPTDPPEERQSAARS